MSRPNYLGYWLGGNDTRTVLSFMQPNATAGLLALSSHARDLQQYEALSHHGLPLSHINEWVPWLNKDAAALSVFRRLVIRVDAAPSAPSATVHLQKHGRLVLRRFHDWEFHGPSAGHTVHHETEAAAWRYIRDQTSLSSRIKGRCVWDLLVVGAGNDFGIKVEALSFVDVFDGAASAPMAQVIARHSRTLRSLRIGREEDDLRPPLVDLLPPMLVHDLHTLDLHMQMSLTNPCDRVWREALGRGPGAGPRKLRLCGRWVGINPHGWQHPHVLWNQVLTDRLQALVLEPTEVDPRSLLLILPQESPMLPRDLDHLEWRMLRLSTVPREDNPDEIGDRLFRKIQQTMPMAAHVRVTVPFYLYGFGPENNGVHTSPIVVCGRIIPYSIAFSLMTRANTSFHLRIVASDDPGPTFSYTNDARREADQLAQNFLIVDQAFRIPDVRLVIDLRSARIRYRDVEPPYLGEPFEDARYEYLAPLDRDMGRMT